MFEVCNIDIFFFNHNPSGFFKSEKLLNLYLMVQNSPPLLLNHNFPFF